MIGELSRPTPQPWGEAVAPSWYQRLYARNGDRRVHHGIRLTITIFNAAAGQAALTKVRAALDVLRDAAPCQLERLQNHVHSIAVARLHTSFGRWVSDLRAAVIDADFVLAKDTSPARLAMVIVHELTHARLERFGFRYGPQTRVRIERMCCLAERNFIARLPVSDERTRLERINASYLNAPAPFWSDEAQRERAAQWLSRQPPIRRSLHHVLDFILRAHRAVILDNRWS